MTAAARSILVFGFYLYMVGLLLLVIPNTVLSLLQLPETQEVWIRILGVVTITLGFFYHHTARKNMEYFFWLTIPARFFAFACFTTFVLFNYTTPALLGIAAIDLAGATWTMLALKK